MLMQLGLVAFAEKRCSQKAKKKKNPSNEQKQKLHVPDFFGLRTFLRRAAGADVVQSKRHRCFYSHSLNSYQKLI